MLWLEGLFRLLSSLRLCSPGFAALALASDAEAADKLPLGALPLSEILQPSMLPIS